MSNVNCPICKGTGVYAPGNVVEKSTGTYWEDDKACPNCYPNELNETIFDRDLRAIVSGWVSDPAIVITDTDSIKRILALCISIALEMEISRNKRKGLKHE